MPRDAPDVAASASTMAGASTAPGASTLPGAATVIAGLIARRTARSGALGGVMYGLYVFSSVTSFATVAKTAAQRAKLAGSLGNNAGLSAMIGTARRIDTVAGFTAWRALGVLSIGGAIWGLLTATRLTRGEEDSGRWDLLLTGQTTRRRAAAQTMMGLAAGLGCLWVVTAVLVVGVGRTSQANFTTGGALFLSVALAASAAMFMVVGALCGQLAATRRQATSIAAAVFGAAYLLRMVADSGSGLGWLRWASPLGWVEELHPLTGTRAVALLPIAGLTIVLGGFTVWLAGWRDVGARALPTREPRAAHLGLLNSTFGLNVRLIRPVAIAWTAGLGVLGLVGGLVAQSAASAISGSATVATAMARIGAHRGGAAAYLGIFFLIGGAAIAFAAAGQVAATREEEAGGHADNLFARPVGRVEWLMGRVTVVSIFVAVAAVATSATAWVGAASQHTGVSFGDLAQAGINLVPPALFVLGVGTLVYGLAPRAAATTTYTFVAWSLLLELVGSGIKLNHWLLDASLFAHVAPAPAATPNWIGGAWLVVLGALAAAVGASGFNRRDLTGA